MFRPTCRARLLLVSAFVFAFACARAPSAPKPALPAARALPAPTHAARGHEGPTHAASTHAAPAQAAPPSASITPPALSPSDDPPREELGIPEVEHAFRAPLPAGPLTRSSPAFVVSNLSPAGCLSELRRRNLPVEREGGPADGVAVPVRIKGSMHGVHFVTPSRKSVFGKLDCRLALALDELSKVLARHDVVRVRVDNLYRPNARLAGTHTRSQHRYGLAIDLVSFELAGGLELSVESDWRGALESPPCGPESRLVDVTERAITLRDIVCDVAKSGLFHHILTPNFNAAHRDHLHFDIKRGDTRWVVE